MTDKLDDVRADAAAFSDGVDDGGKAREGGSEEGREGRVSVCSTIARETRLVRESGSKEGEKGGTYLSSVRIRSAACLVTSLPFLPMAMPTSAALSEGASLTPSPEK